ncbi:hypothetical protein JMJ77_0010304 [Colletotrichum scovillei]|uniref:Uncharacterized protein n=1 Tax=Colletotrichum scovillei TaxID=1209932 RepID=A0A9P7QVD1_9PEZI|nr:hypothetical protein JMJ78_0011681 [Colletotrichum scovillei]KAG7042202.1 hypothetical protein JMJ77_0010304 [Colletotrichum scovillei]KAG7062235.1 hypothetical protein JMJ76_0006512 [Colletotrichum scovillei]
MYYGKKLHEGYYHLRRFAATLASLPWKECANYKFCHCYDDNGMPNDLATNIICPGNLELRMEFGVTFEECYYYKNYFSSIRCMAAGATGSNSSCGDKVEYVH